MATRFKAKDIANEILNSEDAIISIPEFIYNKFKKEGFSDLESSSNSSRFINRVKKYLGKELEKDKQKEVISIFDFDKINNDIIVILTNLPSEKIEMVELIALKYKQKIKEFLKTLNWREFEVIGKLVLESNDVTDCELTPRGKEGGVDVYGWLKSKNKIDSKKRLWNNLVLRVITQCKHRPSNQEVKNSEVSEFFTDTKKLRAKRGRAKSILPSDFVTSSSPLLPILITNGYYGPDAEDTANDEHLIIWDERQICEDLVKHPKFLEWIENDKLNFDYIKTYINNHLV